MRIALLAVLAALAAACTPAGQLDPRAQAVACLPKGVYLGAAAGVDYSDEQMAAIDALRILNCPDPAALGYAVATAE